MQSAGLCAGGDRLTVQRALPGLCEVAAAEGSRDVSQVRRHDHGRTGRRRRRVAQDCHRCRVILLALVTLYDFSLSLYPSATSPLPHYRGSMMVDDLPLLPYPFV